MAFGDKTITFNQVEVGLLQDIVREFGEEHDALQNDREWNIISSIQDKLRNTPSSLT